MRAMIWYQKPGAGIGYEAAPVQLSRLTETHTYLIDADVQSLGELVAIMQSETWSPYGEARRLIEQKELKHTSFSAGDVVYWRGAYFVSDGIEFQRLERQPAFTGQAWQEMLVTAEAWRYLVAVKAAQEPNPIERQRLERAAIKSYLDRWLMIHFGLTETEARDLSNLSMSLLAVRFGAKGVEWRHDSPTPQLEQYPDLVDYLDPLEVYTFMIEKGVIYVECSA